MISTPALIDAPVELWKEHRFGLPESRWSALKGKRFWITGAGTGYGRAIACSLAAAGAHVVLSGRRLFKLEETVEDMGRLGVDRASAFCLPVDLSDEKEIITACGELGARGICFDGIIHSAALPSKPGCRYPLLDNSSEDWGRIMNVNVRAPWLLTRAALQSLFRSTVARILLITSEAGWAGTSGVGLYNISKAALNSLGQSMACEFAECFPRMEIQINVLSPGEAFTEMNQGSNVSPYAISSMTLALMSHPEGGPNGCYFHRDGRHLSFGHAKPFEKPLIWREDGYQSYISGSAS